MSNLMGKLADRASIIRSAFSELDNAVIKATKHNTKMPKEKHVRRLVVFTHDEPHRIPEMIALLAKRLEFPDWLVVMKTLGTFHRLMRDGNLQVINELRYKSNIFNLRRFADTSSPEAHHQSIFVRKYSQYLEEKVLVYKILSVEFEKDATITKTYTIDEAFDRIPRLQSQMNALLNCRASKDHLNNSIIVNSFGMLLKDSFKLYKALNDGIINLLEHYFTMPKEKAQKALDIYKLFAKETDGIIQFYDISRKISRTDLPELQHAPTTLVEALENYIKEIEEGRTPSSASSIGNMEKLKRDQSHMEKFEFFEAEGQEEESDSDDEKKGGSRRASQSQMQRPNSNTGAQSSPQNPQRSNNQGFQSNNQPSFQPQTSASLIDPFDLPTSSPNTQHQPRSTGPPMFDPFGGDDFFSSPNPPMTALSTSSSMGSSAPFDPFATAFSTQASGPLNQVAYDDKKKNIEQMFGQQPITPTSPVLQHPQSGFGNAPTFNPNQNTGFGASPFDNSFGGPFGGNAFQNQQQQPSPFHAQPQQPFQTQQQFKPVTATNSNPFLTDNSNPFG